MRILHILIKSCEDCPYYQYDSDYSMTRNSGYEYTNDEASYGLRLS